MTKKSIISLVVTGAILIAAAVATFVMFIGDSSASPAKSGVDTSLSPSAPSDSGTAACKVMQHDKATGQSLSDAQESIMIPALLGSDNADLAASVDEIMSDDPAVSAEGISKLYTGCAALGISIG